MNDKNPSMFQSVYESLNTSQKEAVDHIEGPVMVVAGPGTGKTQIIATRIANILIRTQMNPENILCLTYTKTGAANMKERVEKLTGKRLQGLSIHTFHSFCKSILEDFPHYFEDHFEKTLISDVEKYFLIEKILDQNSNSILRPSKSPHLYLKDLISNFATLKREHFSPKEYSELASSELETLEQSDEKFNKRGELSSNYKDQKKRLEKALACAKLYDAYEKLLEDEKKYDFEDLINVVIKALENDPDLRASLQEKYQYLLVDEHQDTNNSQNYLLELLCSFDENPNLFVVGDAKQAIYRFQGASLANFAYLSQKFPTTKIITLTKNYRSQQHILDSAFDILGKEKNKERLQSHFESTNKLIQLHEFATQREEQYFLYQSCQDLLSHGTKPQDICILTSGRGLSSELFNLFDRYGLPVKTQSKESIFKLAIFTPFFQLLQYLLEFERSDLLALYLQGPLSPLESPLSYFRIQRIANQERISLVDLIEILNQKDNNDHTLSDKELQEIKSLWQNLLKMRKAIFDGNILKGIYELASSSGYLDFLLGQTDPNVAIAPLRGFLAHLQEIPTINTLKPVEFCAYLKGLQKHEIEIEIVSNFTEKENKILIVNAHQVKGLEFAHVFVAGLTANKWEKKRTPKLLEPLASIYNRDFHSMNSDQGYQDALNLLFVCMTRAGKHLTLSYSLQNAQGTSTSMSALVENIREELIEKYPSHKESLVPAEFGIEVKKTVNTNVTMPMYFQDLIHDYLINKAISATHLTTFQKCPWQFFYQNLLRVPSLPELPMQLGTAFHDAVHRSFLQHFPSQDQFIQLFLSRLRATLIAPTDMNSIQSTYLPYLSKWYSSHLSIFSSYRESEVKVDITYPLKKKYDKLDQIHLTGKIDMIAKQETDFAVIDFKTGVPKSKNELLGLNKSGDATYFLQLLFYKLLLDGSNSAYQVKQGMIDFLQIEDFNAKIVQFDLDLEAMSHLRGLLENFVDSLYTCKFWGESCEKVDCDYCTLANNMKAKLTDKI